VNTEESQKTAKANFKVAVHYIELSRRVEAWTLLKRAQGALIHNKDYRAEYARVLHWLGKVCAIEGDDIAAMDLSTQAANIRRELVPDDTRSAEELVDSDFDELMVFWGR
jgi:hypothetical protein